MQETMRQLANQMMSDDRGSESTSKALWIAAIIVIALGATAFLGPRVMEWLQAIPSP